MYLGSKFYDVVLIAISGGYLLLQELGLYQNIYLYNFSMFLLWTYIWVNVIYALIVFIGLFIKVDNYKDAIDSEKVDIKSKYKKASKNNKFFLALIIMCVSALLGKFFLAGVCFFASFLLHLNSRAGKDLLDDINKGENNEASK